MKRLARLWFLLFVAFTAVFILFVNHDLLGFAGDRIIIMEKASPLEVASGSAVAGFILSSLTTALHAAGERFLDRKSIR